MEAFIGSAEIDDKVSRRLTDGIVPLLFIFPDDHPKAGDPVIIVHASDFWRSREGQARRRFEDILKETASGKPHPAVKQSTLTLGCGTKGTYFYGELPHLEAAVHF